MVSKGQSWTKKDLRSAVEGDQRLSKYSKRVAGLFKLGQGKPIGKRSALGGTDFDPDSPHEKERERPL